MLTKQEKLFHILWKGAEAKASINKLPSLWIHRDLGKEKLRYFERQMNRSKYTEKKKKKDWFVSFILQEL